MDELNMIGRVKEIKHIISWVVEKCVKVVVYCLPMKEQIVLECESDMDDNPRAFYEYLLEIGWNQKHRIVWIVRDDDYCRQKYGAKNVIFITREKRNLLNRIKVYYYLRTSWLFVFSHPYWYHKTRKKQIVANVWHGVPIKGVSLTDNKDNHKCFDFFIAPTKEVLPFFAKIGFPEEKAIICGAPRLDELFNGNPEEVFSRLFPYQNGDKVIICMPTYKQCADKNDSTVRDQFTLEVIRDVNEYILLNSFLRKNNVHLIIKPHPLQVVDDLWLEDATNIHYINNRLLLDRNIILYRLLGCCDALISDVSSVIYDYLLLNRPIGILTRCFDQYTRGFLVENIVDYLPGTNIRDFDDLVSFVIDCLQDNDRLEEKRQSVSRTVNKLPAGNYCEEFYKLLFCGKR